MLDLLPPELLSDILELAAPPVSEQGSRCIWDRSTALCSYSLICKATRLEGKRLARREVVVYDKRSANSLRLCLSEETAKDVQQLMVEPEVKFGAVNKLLHALPALKELRIHDVDDYFRLAEVYVPSSTFLLYPHSKDPLTCSTQAFKPSSSQSSKSLAPFHCVFQMSKPSYCARFGSTGVPGTSSSLRRRSPPFAPFRSQLSTTAALTHPSSPSNLPSSLSST
jgi:hypothetical protein